MFDVSCNGGNVTVFDGLMPSNKLLGNYCGSDVPDETSTSGTALTIRLSTDGKENKYKFKANYTVKTSKC